MTVHITCRTDRFNLSVVGPDFINDCCFGEDFSVWLISALSASGVTARVICMEDFGWSNLAEHQGVLYLMNIAGTPDENPENPDYGEWHVLLERSRTFTQKLLGKHKISRTEPIVSKVIQVLRDAGFAAVMLEA